MSTAANDSPGTILRLTVTFQLLTDAPEQHRFHVVATPQRCQIREKVTVIREDMRAVRFRARIREDMRVGGPTLHSAGTARQQHPHDTSPAPSAPTGARTRRMNQSPARHSDLRPRSVLAGLA
jgi:hypothetical protein